MTCVISKQIAEHCDDDAKLCPECWKELEEKSESFMGEWLECPACGWHNFKDE